MQKQQEMIDLRKQLNLGKIIDAIGETTKILKEGTNPKSTFDYVNIDAELNGKSGKLKSYVKQVPYLYFEQKDKPSEDERGNLYYWTLKIMGDIIIPTDIDMTTTNKGIGFKRIDLKIRNLNIDVNIFNYIKNYNELLTQKSKKIKYFKWIGDSYNRSLRGYGVFSTTVINNLNKFDKKDKSSMYQIYYNNNIILDKKISFNKLNNNKFIDIDNKKDLIVKP